MLTGVAFLFAGIPFLILGFFVLGVTRVSFGLLGGALFVGGMLFAFLLGWSGRSLEEFGLSVFECYRFLREKAARLAVLFIAIACANAGADIRETKHNLADPDRLVVPVDASDRDTAMRRIEREVCVFCHTPNAEEHGPAGRLAPPAAPLWQRTAERTLSFGLFDDIGRTGAGGADPVGSVSMACLSCHDSSQALGIGEEHGADHPFGVPYRGPSAVEAVSRQTRQRMTREGALEPFRLAAMIREDSAFRPVHTAVVNDRQIWWASASGGSRRSKSDLPLYPRQVDENYRIPFVECTSCHDPHVTREVFLRTSPDQGALCMTCHIK